MSLCKVSCFKWRETRLVGERVTYCRLSRKKDLLKKSIVRILRLISHITYKSYQRSKHFKIKFTHSASAQYLIKLYVKALLHDAIFLATCNAILLSRHVNYSEDCLICKDFIRKIWRRLVLANITSLNSGIAMQVARKIASCNMQRRLFYTTSPSNVAQKMYIMWEILLTPYA